MVYYCFVKDCKSTTYGKNQSHTECITWHGLPTNTALQEKLAHALDVQVIPKSSRICSKHFTSDCFERNGLSKQRLKSSSVPTLLIHSRTQSGALREISTDTNYNITDRENCTVVSEPELKRSKQNLTSLCLHSSIVRNDQQEMILNAAVMNEEGNVAMPETWPETPKKHTINNIRYPGDISQEIAAKMSPRTMMKSMLMLKKACNEKDTRIKRLQRTQRGQKRKIETLQQLLTDLRKSDLISSNAYDILENMSPEDSNIAKDIERGKVQGKYPEHLRSFALTLHFYSPRAYNYVRQVYRNKLPASSTIRAWYSSTNGSPGITKESIDALKNKNENTPEKKLFACLMADEMAIRKQAEWNHSKKRFVGYVDLGTMIPEPENLPLAKESLVYLVTGVNERWKIPVAYFLLNGLTAQERAEITKQVLIAIAATGIFMIALTFDGLRANLAMCSELGANVHENEPYFMHPSNDDLKVRIIFDAAHMEKLIRNAFASRGILYDGQNNPIEWKYIERLVKLQEDSLCHLGNKLNRKHLQWEKNKMNVKLASQTLSESVAVALEQLLKDGHEDFVDCAATIKFILMVNHTFDCLNSRSLFSKRFKQPITQKSAAEIFNFFDDAQLYFSQIKLQKNGKSILETRLKTGFLGFIIDMQNFKEIYLNFVANGSLKYILTYKFSQDHLETFFSCVRTMGGYNNNPNSTQFMAAYKKLLHRNEIKSSAEANCIPLDDTNILTVSSRRENAAVKPTEKDVDSIVLQDLPLDCIDPIAHHAVLYIAGFVERKVLRTLKCETCHTLLGECQPMTSSFINNKSFGSLQYPSIDTHSIVSATEKVINWYRVDNTITDANIYSKIFINVSRNLNFNLIFTNFDAHVKDLEFVENHKYYLIKLIIDYYIKTKLSYYGKEFTRRQHGKYLRNWFNKTILFNGQ